MEKDTRLGTVVWFNKGYGFISQGEGQPDIFVHYSDITIDGFRTLKKDQRVSYQLGTNVRGEVKAVNVIPL